MKERAHSLNRKVMQAVVVKEIEIIETEVHQFGCEEE